MLDVARKKKPLNKYIDADLRDRFDAWAARQPFGVNTTKVIEKLLTDFLDEQEAEEERAQK